MKRLTFPLVVLAIFLALVSATFPPVEMWRLFFTENELGVLSRRAAAVQFQHDHPFAVPPDALHGAIQWRVLPALLPYPLAWGLLGTLAVVAYALRIARRSLPWSQAVWVGVLFCFAGWSSISVTVLGYFDCLLVLALLAVGFGSSWALVLASLLGPWVDERFVLAFPLAMLVRWIHVERPRNLKFYNAWLPSVLVLAFVLVRLFVLPNGENARPASYLANFPPLRGSSAYLALGIVTAWRLAWPFAILGWLRVRGGVVVGALAAVVVFVGLATAQDYTRSMMLVAPAIMLGLLRVAPSMRESLWPVAVVAALLPSIQVIERVLMNHNTWANRSHLPTPDERLQMREFWRSTYPPAWKRIKGSNPSSRTNAEAVKMEGNSPSAQRSFGAPTEERGRGEAPPSLVLGVDNSINRLAGIVLIELVPSSGSSSRL